MKKTTPPDDNFTVRCPKLGHQIYFSYCRSENTGLPCFKILDCWHVHFSVENHLKNELSKDKWEKAFKQKVKPKVISLIELIEQAKKVNAR